MHAYVISTCEYILHFNVCIYLFHMYKLHPEHHLAASIKNTGVKPNRQCPVYPRKFGSFVGIFSPEKTLFIYLIIVIYHLSISVFLCPFI